MKRLLLSLVMAVSIFSGVLSRVSAMGELGNMERDHAILTHHIARAQATPQGTPVLSGYDCQMPLRVTLRQGPDSGLVLFGVVGMNFDKHGGATGVFSVVAPADHMGEIPMFGQINGRAVSLMFNVSDKEQIYGVGTSQEPVTSNCNTNWGGPVVGPGDGDTGDWACTPNFCCGGGVCMICQLVGSTNVCVKDPVRTSQN